uniref:Uncharacterized protein n=1 Tax=viral metagenome TaxID=1070528 RepID=A0A6M3JWG9_9ZZZZ
MGFETLLNIIKQNEEQALIDEVEAMNPTECPYDAWPLDENSKGEKSCPICERLWR